MTLAAPLPTNQADRVLLPVYESAFKADPFALYRRLRCDGREVAPVVLPSGVHGWLVLSYAAAMALLNDPRLSKDSAIARANWHEHHPTFENGTSAPVFKHLLTMDPPEHTRLRAMVQSAFSPRRIALLRPRVEAIAANLLNRMGQHGSADLIESFAMPLPLQVVCEILGVPLADQSLLRRWSRILVTAELEEQELIPTAATELRHYLLGLAGDGPVPGSLFQELAQRWRAAELTDGELVALGFLILVAGHETTVNLISSGVLALLTDRSAWLDLAGGTVSAAAMVEELLRLESPIDLATPRFARERLTVSDCVIEAGDTVFVGIAAANRDAARFACPDRLIPGRANGYRHLAFGHGVHFCLGAALARLEGEIALDRLSRSFPRLELAVARETLRWRPGPIMRGLRSLPVLLSP